VLIIAPSFPGDDKHDAADNGVVRVPAVQNFNGSDFSVRIPVPFFIDEQIDAFDPEIIHSHHPYLLGDAALRAARRRGLPLIFTHHTLYEEYTHYVTENSRGMKRLAAFLATNYANLCDRVVAPSMSLKNLIQERGVNVPVSEIPTGVDIPFFEKGDGLRFCRQHEMPEQLFVIGHLGRLAPEKNLDFLAASVTRAMADHTETCFLVVGDGPSRKNIADRMEAAGLQDRLIMPGSLTGRDLADAYQVMNIFAFTSQSETQGLVLTEAMAAGVPVIALDASGTREVVRDGTNGRLLRSNASEADFAAALSDAMANPKKMAAWVEQARNTAQTFARERCAEKLVRLYRETVADGSGSDSSRDSGLDPWDKFLRSCRVEWDLAVEKTQSIIQVVDKEAELEGLDGSDQPNQ
jgi:glycosyltransferase involved in cell wall biosynthesis